MRIAFMGSPMFAVPALTALIDAGHDIAAVYAQPAKPAGRGQRQTPCPVHAMALQCDLNVRTPTRLRGNSDEINYFKDLNLDAAVVAAYGLILPPDFLSAPERGCLNIHASLLPRWRGAAPIQAAILAGDAVTGITIMQMDAGLDTGAIISTRKVAILPHDTAADLHDRLAQTGAELILEALSSPANSTPQNDAEATYAPKLSRENARIDFTEPAVTLERKIRAFHPWPGSLALLNGTAIKFLAAELVSAQGLPGHILDDQLTIACGEDALRPTRLQRPGRAPMSTAEFLRGFPIPANARFF